MLKHLALGAAVAAQAGIAAAQFAVTPLAEADAAAAILSALGITGPSDVDYTGATGQAGLFSNLHIAGARGTSMSLGAGAMLTSGSVIDLPTANDSGWYSNVTEGDAGSKVVKKLTNAGASSSRNSSGSHDGNELAFRFDAPLDGQGQSATAMTVRFVYASEEFPEWSGSIYSDGFGFYLKNSAGPSGIGRNYAAFPDGSPVSLLSADTNRNLLPNGIWGLDGDPSRTLAQIAGLPYDGFTHVLEFTAPLDERDNRVTIGISDTGDQIYDSAVFIAALSFHFGAPPPLGARLAAQSAGYLPLTPAAPVPEPGQWAMLLAGLGIIGVVARRRMAQD